MKARTRRDFLQTALGVAAVRALGGLNVADGETAPSVIVSEFIKGDIKPDADLEKRMWSAAKPVWFDSAAFSESRYPDFKTKVASRWSPQFIYLAFWCPYKALTVFQGEDAMVERDRLWERDVVEAFIAPDPQAPAHYFEFEISPNNQWLDAEIDLARKPINDERWNSGFEHSTKIDAVKRVWTAEMRIPIRSMGVQAIRRGVEWRVNFYRCDGPGDNRTRRMMSWGRLPVRVQGGSFHQPDSFGVLRFDGSS